MNDYSFYISPSEYEQAQTNGISAQLLEKRIRFLAWPKEKAINTPLKQRRLTQILEPWIKLAKQYGICRNTFIQRVNVQKWSYAKAALEPIRDRRDTTLPVSGKRFIPKHYLKLALSNGIKRNTFYARIQRRGWPYVDAATIPVMSRAERMEMYAEKSLAARSREFDRRRILLGAGLGNG